MASDELTDAQMRSHLAEMSQRIANQNKNSSNVMFSMNAIQKFLIPKYQSAYLPYLERILELLLLLCDDTDVSVRHTAAVVLSSSVTIILPFQKSLILTFIASHYNKAYQPHALISMLDLELKVTLFLTQKVALQLFSESATLFNYCAKSSSEIVSEGLYKLAPQIRIFFVEKEKRVKVISNLAKPKNSVLATGWSIKTAAIFACPDLVKVSLKFFKSPYLFLAAVQNHSGKLPSNLNINFDKATLEEIVPFVEIEPQPFYSRLSIVPTVLRELSAYFSCLKCAIPYGIKFPIEILTDTKLRSDPILFSLQLECFALMSLKGTFDHSKIFEVFRNAINSKNANSISMLVTVFNRYPSITLFNMAINLPTSSPTMCKSLILFLTEIDFSRISNSNMVQTKAIDKLVAISHSYHEMVQNTLLKRAPMFNCGKVRPLFEKIYSDIDYFDPLGFRNSLTLLAALISDDCTSEVNSLFANLQEVDTSILYGDAISLTNFLTNIRKICLRCSKVTIPQFICYLPLHVLRAIISMLTGEWSEHHPTNHQFNQLLEQTKLNTLLLSVLSKQSLISLLEIRDKAAACASAIRVHSKVCDDRTLDLIGKKLITWPSRNIWLLISNSAKTLMTTTGGILSLDPNIALSAALKNTEKFNISMINGMTSLTAFAVCNNMEVDFKLSVEFVKIVDRIANNFPDEFVKKMKGSWLVVCIKRHLDHELVQDFQKLPYHKWNGPKMFWDMLPDFLLRLRKEYGWMCELLIEKCDEFHMFFAYKNIRFFTHEDFADYGEIEISNAPEDTTKKSIAKLKPLDYYEPNNLREMRLALYSILQCKTFKKLCKCKRITKNGKNIIQSVIAFLSSENCGIDCFADAILLCFEIAIAKQSEIEPVLLPFLNYAPFRGFSALYSQYVALKNNDTVLQLPKIPNDQPYLESELIKSIPIFLKHGHISSIAIRPLSHITMYKIARFSVNNSFSAATRLDVAPIFTDKNVNSLKKYINQCGVSSFALSCIESWIKEKDIINLFNFALNYVATYGTFFTQRLAQLTGSAMSIHQNMMPVVEAFVLVLDDSPFKAQLKAEFKTVQNKMLIKY